MFEKAGHHFVAMKLTSSMKVDFKRYNFCRNWLNVHEYRKRKHEIQSSEIKKRLIECLEDDKTKVTTYLYKSFRNKYLVNNNFKEF